MQILIAASQQFFGDTSLADINDVECRIIFCFAEADPTGADLVSLGLAISPAFATAFGENLTFQTFEALEICERLVEQLKLSFLYKQHLIYFQRDGKGRVIVTGQCFSA